MAREVPDFSTGSTNRPRLIRITFDTARDDLVCSSQYLLRVVTKNDPKEEV